MQPAEEPVVSLLNEAAATALEHCVQQQILASEKIAALSASLAEANENIKALESESNEKSDIISDLKKQVASLSEENNSLSNDISILSKKIEDSEGEGVNLRQERDLLLLQIHQIQDELERYFLLYRSQSRMLKQHDVLHHRLVRLISNFAE